MATYFTTRESVTETNGVQLMPFSIEFDGEAKVKQYFESSIRKDDEGSIKTASFRGRPIKGKAIDVPHGYIGLIVKESRKAVTEDEDRHLNGIKKFRKFTYWNLDRNPSGDDKIKQALDWMNIAKVLHSPVEVEDSQKSVVGN